MKLDAEFLKKNIFWVLLVAAGPLILIALFVLGPAVGGSIAQEAKKVSDKNNTAKKWPKPISDGNVKWAKEQAEKSKGQETVVWKKASEGQKDLMTWPVEFETEFKFQTGYFAREIQAERGAKAKEPPAGDAAAETPDSPDTYKLKSFSGVIQDTRASWIMVKKDKGKEPAAEEIVPIYNTEKIKVSLTNDKGEDVKDVGFHKLKTGDRVKVLYEIGKYYGDLLTQPEIKKFKATYQSQIHPILKLVNPVNDKGEGIVQLGTWAYKEDEFPKATDLFLTWMPGDFLPDANNYKEIWIAQEDLWIQKEIYGLIAQANDYVAKFKSFEGKTFTNSYWRLDLKLNPGDNRFDLTMTNLLPQTQDANVAFQITFRVPKKDEQGKDIKDKFDYPTQDFFLQGGSLTVNQSRTYKNKTTPEGTVGIEAVTQVLTWETAAVKRIEQISLGSGKRPGGAGGAAAPGPGGPAGPAGGPMGAGVGGPGAAKGGETTGGSAQSNRTFPKELKAFFKLKPKTADGAEKPAPGPGGPGPGGPGPGGVGGPGGNQGKAQESSLSANGFDYKRYSDITPQARRVPVAIVLVIDQSHLAPVLTSFSNSNLRFLTTQVLLNRYPKSITPTKAASDPSKKPGGPGPGVPGPGGPGGPGKSPPGYGVPGFPGGPMGPGIGGPGIGGPGIGGPGIGGPGGADFGSFQATESSAALVEVVIYGTVSLYERFPARPKAADEAGE